MRVSLFVPCLVNHWSPAVGIATLEVLEKLGHEVVVPLGQTCCGQPMTNSGCYDEAEDAARHMLHLLQETDCDAVVCPSASCTVAAKENFEHFEPGSRTRDLTGRIHEFTEFLHDVAPVDGFPRRVERRISLQLSCHGVRMLGLATPSEIRGTRDDKLANLLGRVDGLEILHPEPIDECCGFGGSYVKDEAAVSGKMGRDRARAHVATGADTVVGFDPSCLLHLDGVIRREELPVRTRHVAQILAEAL